MVRMMVRPSCLYNGLKRAGSNFPTQAPVTSVEPFYIYIAPTYLCSLFLVSASPGPGTAPAPAPRERDGPEHERRGREDNVEDKGRLRYSDVNAPHIECAIDQRTNDLEPCN